MRKYPTCIENLMDSLRMLPGIGNKSAERLVLNLIEWNEEQIQTFATNLNNLKANLKFCPQCHGFSEGDLCATCSDHKRDHSTICVVETALQTSLLKERSSFGGLFHVLGGKLKPLDGIGPDELNVESLIERVKTDEVKEVILALSSDIEGEATASFLIEELRPYVEVSKIATGLPIGSDLSYADSSTISAAIDRRYKL